VSGEYTSSSSNDKSSKPPAPLSQASSPNHHQYAIDKKSNVSDESSNDKENLLDLLHEEERILIKETV
jgi:hypothetical protein